MPKEPIASPDLNSNSTSKAPAGPPPANVGPAGDPIPAPVLELIELFAEALPDLKFPGIDSDTLDQLAGEVRAQSQRSHAAQAELDAAMTELRAARKALNLASKRALGYAKVYAEEEPALLARLKEIRLKERKLAPPSRKRRKGTGRNSKAAKAAGSAPEIRVV